MKIPFLFYFILCTSVLAYSQTTNRENYDIRTPGKAPDKPCTNFYTTLRAMPHDARFSAFVKGDSVIFTHSDADWFWQLITGKNDGIAIDLVFKEQYACDNVHALLPVGLTKDFSFVHSTAMRLKKIFCPFVMDMLLCMPALFPRHGKKKTSRPTT